nr:MAG TPA: hypothetical protein [Caudoviricetes sp.]
MNCFLIDSNNYFFFSYNTIYINIRKLIYMYQIYL